MAAAYLLTGPSGPSFDTAVAMLVFLGFDVETVKPQQAYRVRETEAQRADVLGPMSRAHSLYLSYALAALADGREDAAELEQQMRAYARQSAAHLDSLKTLAAQAAHVVGRDLHKLRPAPGALLAQARAVVPKDIGFAPEPVSPHAVIRSSAPRDRYARTTTVAGLAGFNSLSRAVDMGLVVSNCDPESLRYTVTGPTANQVRFLAQMQRGTDAAALAALGITAETVAEEDRPDVPEIKVSLPTRTTTSDIKHDNEGRIVHVTQKEASEG